MSTDCTSQTLHLQASGRRRLTAAFDGGHISSDAGALLLRAADEEMALTERLAGCFVDLRDPKRVEHSVLDLVRQRLFALAMGYEDLNDHDDLRGDPLLAEVVGKREPTGEDRVRDADRGRALAGKSTLNRLEWALGSEAETDRYHRVALDPEAMNTYFVDLFLDSFEQPPEEIILDFDATDDPLHGQQEGRFFHGYYDCYCYLPLYVFYGHHLLWAQLRTADRDASDGTVDVLEILVPRIRERWPQAQILLRGDSGFARDAILSWCEDNEVRYVVGLARNQRLERMLEPTLERAEERRSEDEPKVRLFEDLEYETLNSWSRSRRVVGKAEVSSYGRNPRFVVTSIPAEELKAQYLYDEIYCARGDAENRIKEQQLDLFATRTSGRKMAVNQVRLWFSAAAYCLLNALRRLGLQGTRFAKAQCGTIRTKLLKIGAVVRVTTRRIWVSMSSSYPNQDIFAHVLSQLRRRLLPHPS